MRWLNVIELELVPWLRAAGVRRLAAKGIRQATRNRAAAAAEEKEETTGSQPGHPNEKLTWNKLKDKYSPEESHFTKPNKKYHLDKNDTNPLRKHKWHNPLDNTFLAHPFLEKPKAQ